MDEQQIERLIGNQRAFFSTGKTLAPEYRIAALKRLRTAILAHEARIHAALEQDLGKSRFESYMCEVGLACSELSYMISHLRGFASEKRVPTPLAQFASRSCTKPFPFGVTLIMSPWNYPFMLTIDPLADALAAGNTVILKPSAYSPRTSAVIQELIAECFDPSYVAVITGGRAENQCLLRQKFDYIFFTGSQSVGREVLRQAAEHLTPVTLELGGKSPCLVDASANLPLAAKRIVFGKFLNCGQTCVATDYLYCDETIKDALLDQIKLQIQKQFGAAPLQNPDYGKIVNQKHFERLTALLTPEKTVFGGGTEPEACRIEPTVLENIGWDDPAMSEEIFGPILPVLTYHRLEEAVQQINSRPHPLALYLFSQDKKNIRFVTNRCQFGGGCINDTVIHLATSQMGFGGVGASGMGAYHGKAGFETFSHRKSIVDKKTWLDLPMRYQPYRPRYEKLLRFFLR